MNSHILNRSSGKGVSPWVPLAVFVAVLALLIALLPISSTSARADETIELDQVSLSEVVEDSAPADVGGTNSEAQDDAVSADIPAVEVDGAIPAEELEEPSFVDEVLSLFGAPEFGTFALRSEVVVTVDGAVLPGGQVGDVYVGDEILINGTWDGRDLSPKLQNGDSFNIQLPPSISLVNLGFDLMAGDGTAWGYCTPNVAANLYSCALDAIPPNLTGANGVWQGAARAIAEDQNLNILPAGESFELGKTGRMVYTGPDLGTEPAGTVTQWTVTVDSDNITSFANDIIIDDTFDDKLRVCAVTQPIATQGFSGAIDVSYVQSGNNLNFTLHRPAQGFGFDPIMIRYNLCTESEGMDASGTVYANSAGSMGSPSTRVSATVTQTLSTSGTAVGVNRGSFDLNKVIDPSTIPAGFVPADNPFTVHVQEYAPGIYAAGGSPEAEYDISVDANGSSLSGRNARPADWTIVLSEVVSANPVIDDFAWETPVFSGAGVAHGTDAAGNPTAIITTNLDGLVGVTLTNALIDTTTPNIGTTAQVTGSPDNILPITGGEVVDTVAYENLEPETAYRLEGEIMHVADNGNVTSTGVTSSATFTTGPAVGGAARVSGEADITFTISAAIAEQFANQKLVVFEQLFDPASPTPEEPVATHEDPDDPAQSFWVEEPSPEIGSSAQVTGSPENVLSAAGGTVVDTIAYKFLKPNTEYRLYGEIMHVDDASIATSTGVTASETFTTGAAAAGELYVSGTTEVTFTISAAIAEQFAGQKLVIFEQLFDSTSPTPEAPVATHVDPDDAAQTFWVEEPEIEIGTTAEVTGSSDNILPITGGEVVDTVAYTNLKPNTEYRLDGEIMHVDENGTVTSTGVNASTTFTTDPAAAGEFYVSGTADVTFQISGAVAVEYGGEKLVVFEQLFNPASPTPEEPIATHEDPEDPAQTFEIEPDSTVIFEKEVTGPKGDDVMEDEDAVFQIQAEWVDRLGVTHTRVLNVTPGSPVELENLPLNTEITLTEIGAETSVSNIKWGDIIWSGTGVVDQPGNSPDGTVTLDDADAPIRINLENKTSSNGLIIIPIPIPLPPGGGSSEPPAPTTPVRPDEPVAPGTPGEEVAGATPAGATPSKPVATKGGSLASTGANVVWLSGGGILVLLAGTWFVLRGRRNNS